MGKSFKPMIDAAIKRLRDEFESALGKGKTYTERDFEMFKLGRVSLIVELPNADDFGDEEILFKYKELVEYKLIQAGITVK